MSSCSVAPATRAFSPASRPCWAFRRASRCIWPRSSSARRCAACPAGATPSSAFSTTTASSWKAWRRTARRRRRVSPPTASTSRPIRIEIREPSGRADLRHVTYRALDARRTRVEGATFEPAERLTMKLEGAAMSRLSRAAHRRRRRSAVHRPARGDICRRRARRPRSRLRGRDRGLPPRFSALRRRRGASRGRSRPRRCRARHSSWASASRPRRSGRRR